jgi:hypothetical protein
MKIFSGVQVVGKKNNKSAGTEVLTGAVMKNPIFWDIMPCSPLKVKQCFTGTYCPHLQG